MDNFRSSIGNGQVMHRRRSPRAHVFNISYPVIRLDLSELDRLDQQLKFFSLNGTNFVSLRPSDYGDENSRTITDFVRRKMHELGSVVDNYRIELLTYPRICGFAFNPISCFLCSDPEGELIGVIFEVKSTFGERCHYSFLVTEHGAETHLFAARKQMQVSPFNRIEGDYLFRLSTSHDHFRVAIQYRTTKGTILSTLLTAQLKPLSDRKLISHFGFLPISMFGTFIAIHWNAILLWLKGVPFIGSARSLEEKNERKTHHV